MILAVLDTNVLAACAVATTGALAALLRAWESGDFRVVVSAHILGELNRALDNDYFASRLSAAQRQAYVDRLAASTTIVDVTAPIPTVVSTLGDNLVLATAESGGAQYLITGDAELLRLARYKSTEILTPRRFRRVLETMTHGER